MARTLEKDIDLGLGHLGILLYNPQERDFSLVIQAQDPDGKRDELCTVHTLAGKSADDLIGAARAWVADVLGDGWVEMVEVYISHRFDHAVQLRIHEFELIHADDGWYRRVDKTSVVRPFSPSVSAIQFYNKDTDGWRIPLVDKRTYDTSIIMRVDDPKCEQIEVLELKIQHFVEMAIDKLTGGA